MKKKFEFSAVGISSLLVTFSVLCLIVFAMLTVSTVEAELRLADSTRRAVTDYYNADCEANKILSRLRNGEYVECVTVNENIYSYTCPISKTKELSVAVKLEENDFIVIKWQEVSTVEWNEEDRLPVWDGQTP